MSEKSRGQRWDDAGISIQPSAQKKGKWIVVDTVTGQVLVWGDMDVGEAAKEANKLADDINNDVWRSLVDTKGRI